MDLDRRKLLAVTLKGGAAAAVVGTGALGWRLYDTGLVGGTAEPLEGWSSFHDSPAGEPLSLVAAAVLAASPHNTQPWRFVVNATQIDLFASAERHLGSFDPYRREMWLGLGCAVENMVQAAGAKGFAVESVVAAPGALGGADAGGHAAKIVVRAADRAAASRLAASIETRRTNRSDYRRDEPVAQRVIALLEAAPAHADTRLILFRASEDRGLAFARATVIATEAICADATMSSDSHRWLRANPREVARHRDGLSIPTSGLAPWLSTVGQVLPAPAPLDADRYWIDSTRSQVDSAPWFGLLLVRELHDRRQQIEAGRLWQRIQLELTAAGLASQPLNQMIEVVDRERQLGRDASMARRLASCSGTGWHATFAFRFGHASRKVPHSARRALSSVSGRSTDPAPTLVRRS